MNKLNWQDDAGVSLVEVIVAFIVLSIVMTATVHSAVLSMQVTDRARDTIALSSIAEREIETLRALPLDSWAVDETKGINDQARYNNNNPVEQTYVVRGPEGQEYEVTRKYTWKAVTGNTGAPTDPCLGTKLTAAAYGHDYVEVDLTLKTKGKHDPYVHHVSTNIGPRLYGNKPDEGSLLIKLYDSKTTQTADTRLNGTISLKVYKRRPETNYAEFDKFDPTPVTQTSSNGCFYLPNLGTDLVKVELQSDAKDRMWLLNDVDNTVDNPGITEVLSVSQGLTTVRNYIYPKFQTVTIRPFLNSTEANKGLAGHPITCSNALLGLDERPTSPRAQAGLAITPKAIQHQFFLQCTSPKKAFYLPNFMEIRTTNVHNPNGSRKAILNADTATKANFADQWKIRVVADDNNEPIDAYFGQCGLALHQRQKTLTVDEAQRYATGVTKTLDSKAVGTRFPFTAGDSSLTLYLPTYPAVYNGWSGTDGDFDLTLEPVYFIENGNRQCPTMKALDMGLLKGQWERIGPDQFQERVQVDPVSFAIPSGWHRNRFGPYVSATDHYVTTQFCKGQTPDTDPLNPGNYTDVDYPGYCKQSPTTTKIQYNEVTHQYEGQWLGR